MSACRHCGREHRVGFVATRLAGTDGVSLETEKWVRVFEEQGFRCAFFGGELDTPAEASWTVAEAHFLHPAIRDLYRGCFGLARRSPATTRKLHHYCARLKDQLYRFVERFAIDLLVVENALTIPLNLPLGMALAELISETALPTIAHHHDFYWERQHFLTNAAWEILNMAFPPQLPSIQHVVISSAAGSQLGLRTGIAATIIPNVMDFDHPPPPVDDFAADVRRSLGLAAGELLVLQPTRVVKRKGIEHAIELVRRLGRKARLVISHASGDEGHAYERRVREYARLMGVDTLFISQIIGERRGRTADGRKIYALEDIYPHADLVTYPSDFEGFGNAFLEAVYFRKPIVVNTYSIYQMDIRPRGFAAIEIDGYVTEEALERTRQVLDDAALRQAMVEGNFDIARRCFSYAVLRRKLANLLGDGRVCGLEGEMPMAQEGGGEGRQR
jgi:glycosyltransferase involved in cell wall biosynthesis